ncbi:unnamed protein product [Camellia sinensis]
MKDLFGSPGKVSGLVLRIGQCLFAAASIGVMASASGFSGTTAFCCSCWGLGSLVTSEGINNYLIASMGDLHNHVTAILSLAAACSSAGVVVLFSRDTNFCRVEKQLSCICSCWGLGSLVTNEGINNYLIASMGLQILWSFGLACLDIHALRLKRDLHNHVLVSLFVVGDWVTAILSLAAACSSAGVVVLFSRDTNFCRVEKQLSCTSV